MNLNLIKVLDREGDAMLLNADDFVCAHQRIERGQKTDSMKFSMSFVNLGEEGRGAACNDSLDYIVAAACNDSLDSIVARIKAKLIMLTLKKGTQGHDIEDMRIFFDPTKIKRLALERDGKTVSVLVQNDIYIVEESTEKVLELIALAGVEVNIV